MDKIYRFKLLLKGICEKVCCQNFHRFLLSFKLTEIVKNSLNCFEKVLKYVSIEMFEKEILVFEYVSL